jgi:hypothetical protein
MQRPYYNYKVSFLIVLSLLAQRKSERKGGLRSFLGLSFFQLSTHYNSSPSSRDTQTVMLAHILRFRASKMTLLFQKRSGSITRLTAIWEIYYLCRLIKKLSPPFPKGGVSRPCLVLPKLSFTSISAR